MAYTPVSLGQIYGEAQQIQSGQQRQKLGALQLQAAQTDQDQTQGINDTLANNKDPSLADLSKFGTRGIQASQDLNKAKADNLLQQNRQLYVNANQVANADDPVAEAQKVAPQLVQQYEAKNGPGSFAQLPPDQVKKQASDIAQHALLGLVDPDKQYAAQQTMLQDHYKQQGPGGEAERNANTVTGAAARTQAEIAARAQQEALNRANAVYLEGLRAGNAKIPSGYEADPATPGSLRPIGGGPADPNATSGKLGSREGVMFQRVMSSANEAVTAIKNISELPITTDTGIFGHAQPGTGLFDSVKSVLAQKVTGQEAQDMKTMVAGVSRALSTIETAGLAPNGSITKSMDNITINDGDTQWTKLRKMAEMRQIVEKGIEPNLANKKLGPAQLQLVQSIISQVREAIPFTQHDITMLVKSKDPQATIMDFAKQQGLPSSGVPDDVAALLQKYAPPK